MSVAVCNVFNLTDQCKLDLDKNFGKNHNSAHALITAFSLIPFTRNLLICCLSST